MVHNCTTGAKKGNLDKEWRTEIRSHIVELLSMWVIDVDKLLVRSRLAMVQQCTGALTLLACRSTVSAMIIA